MSYRTVAHFVDQERIFTIIYLTFPPLPTSLTQIMSNIHYQELPILLIWLFLNLTSHICVDTGPLQNVASMLWPSFCLVFQKFLPYFHRIVSYGHWKTSDLQTCYSFLQTLLVFAWSMAFTGEM